MQPFRSIWQRLRPALVVAVCWLAIHATALDALAKKESLNTQEAVSSGPWVTPYAVVLLGVVAGLLGVCLSSRRKDREKPEAFAAKTTLHKK